ncbi:MAG: adenylate/guanylate cyclase domain-containing protein, partial [Rhodoferax sp.]
LAALVPFRGKQGSFVYVSASAVLQETVDPDLFRGAIVLVGTTAPGLLDLHNTPMQESYAGVEVHANMIAAMLDGSIKQRPAYTLGLEIILLCIVGLPLSWVLPALSPMRATVLVVATQIVMVTTNLYFWNFSNLIVPLASGLVLTVVLFVFNMSYGFFVDSRAKRLLARIFGQYVPQELVDEMAKDPAAYSLAGSNREMTVLFSDVRGFTSISEGLEPEQLTQLMNAYLTPMTEVIQHHRGTIDKYIGDAIMAFWGAPVADQQHARRALQAALDMVASLPRLEDHFKQRGWPPIRIGVGLSTGTMTVGNMGSNFRLAYTVMGDAVNLGSRLEGLTKEYGVQIIVNELTRLAVPEFAFRELDRVCVKGKIKPVKIYEPIGLLSQLSNAEQLELSAYDDALALYQAQYWPEAATAFRLLQRSIPHRVLYQVYLRRIAYFLDHPPAPDWDGSFIFTTK